MEIDARDHERRIEALEKKVEVLQESSITQWKMIDEIIDYLQDRDIRFPSHLFNRHIVDHHTKAA